jgi:hypothetical protein
MTMAGLADDTDYSFFSVAFFLDFMSIAGIPRLPGGYVTPPQMPPIRTRTPTDISSLAGMSRVRPRTRQRAPTS